VDLLGGQVARHLQPLHGLTRQGRPRPGNSSAGFGITGKLIRVRANLTEPDPEYAGGRGKGRWVPKGGRAAGAPSRAAGRGISPRARPGGAAFVPFLL